MDKIIRILAIVAAALLAFSLLLLLVSIPLQPLLLNLVFGYPDHFTEELPMFPTIQFISCFSRLFFVALLVVCCGNKKGGIWLEILLLAALAVALPALGSLMSNIYRVLLNSMSSAYAVAAYSAVNTISNFLLTPANLGLVLAYVTCGMSIAFKLMNKKLEKMEQAQSQCIAPEAEPEDFAPEAEPEDFVPEV